MTELDRLKGEKQGILNKRPDLAFVGDFTPEGNRLFEINEKIRFESIFDELGWERCYRDINVFITKEPDEDGYMTVAFPSAQGYENFESVNRKFIHDFIYKICCHTKFTPEKKKWVVPLLVSDYFAHRYDYKNELKWSKISKKIKNEIQQK